MYKVLETETHIYFISGPLSQWHLATFWANFERGGDKLCFNCAEQYMMASKARVFNDIGTFNDIMESDNPRDQKQLGRMVKNFDPKVWNDQAFSFVLRGNTFRAVQNSEYRNTLINSGKKILVEGNKDDKIWGVGLHWNDPAIQNEKNWQGQNLLGEVNMQVRYHVLEQMDFGWLVLEQMDFGWLAS